MTTILAFDVGGTRIKAGLVRGAAVSASATVDTDESEGAAGVLAAVLRIGRQLMAAQEVVAVGIAVRGIVDPRRGVLLDVNEPLRSLIGQPVTETVARELARPVCMENDARMYALGEL